MKKKLIFLSFIFVFILGLGIDLYHVRYKHAVLILNNMQNALAQMAGKEGHYHYSKALVLKTSQTIFIDNLSVTLKNHQQLNIKKLRIIPASGQEMAKIVAQDVVWQNGSLSVGFKTLYLYHFNFPKIAANQSFTWETFLNSFFQQAVLHSVEIVMPWGRLKTVNMRIKHKGKPKLRLSYRLQNVNYFFNQNYIVKSAESHFDAKQLVIEMPDQQKLIQIGTLLDFWKHNNTTYHLKDIKGYNQSVSPMWFCSDFLLHLNQLPHQVEGKAKLEGVNYILPKQAFFFGNFLQKLGYTSLTGKLQLDFDYLPTQSLLTLNAANYQGHDLLNIGLNGRFSIMINKDDEQNFASLLQKAKLYQAVFFLEDTGLKKRFLQERATHLHMSQAQVMERILQSLKASEQGKDFNLDYQFYQNLAKVIQGSHQQIKVTLDFPQGEVINNFMTLNFLDLFKLANQGNMQIVAVHNSGIH